MVNIEKEDSLLHTVPVKVLYDDLELPIPFYATSGAAGFDIKANENVTWQPFETKLVKTGLAFEIPEGYEIQIRPRSGNSLKTPLRITNAPGTIDSDYRGKVGIIVQNVSNELYSIEKGFRIAQGVLASVVQAEFRLVSEFSETERGDGGFGSTGVK